MSLRTIQAARQAIFNILTTTPLTYTVNNGQMQTVPLANIQSSAPWTLGATEPPDPLISFVVSSNGVGELILDDRRIEIKLWVSTKVGAGDHVTEIYEAIRLRIVSGSEGISPLSRSATGSTLACNITEVHEKKVMYPEFEKDSSRWYISATYSAVAL